MKHTVATCAHLLTDPQWTLVNAKLDAGMELDGTTRRSGLGYVQRKSGWEARGARRKWREQRAARVGA
jgi:hypothetical protein